MDALQPQEIHQIHQTHQTQEIHQTQETDNVPDVPTDSAPVLSTTHLEGFYFYQHDPVFVLLADRWRLNEFVIAAIATATSVVVLFGVAALFHMHFDANYIVRSLLQAFVIFPLLAYICIRIPQEIAILFNALNENHVIGPRRADRDGPADYEQFLERLIRDVDRNWWTYAAFAFVVVYWIYRLFVIEPTLISVEDQSQFWPRVALLLLYSVMIYSLTLAIARLVVALVYANILFRSFKISVNPLHPDGSAGLGVMNRMLGTSAVFISSMGAAAVVMNSAFLSPAIPIAISSTSFAFWEAISMGVFYLCLAPTLLAGWLLAPHEAMQEALNEVLQPLADQFQTTITEAQPAANADAAQIKQGTDRLSELKRRYDLLEDTFPVWPAQIRQIRRWTATISLPAIITFLLSLPEIYKRVADFIINLLHTAH